MSKFILSLFLLTGYILSLIAVFTNLNKKTYNKPDGYDNFGKIGLVIMWLGVFIEYRYLINLFKELINKII
jgi:hypothetical protein